MQADANGPYFGDLFRFEFNIEAQKFKSTTDFSASALPLEKQHQGDVRVGPGKCIKNIKMKFKNNHADSNWPQTTVLYQKENASIIDGKAVFLEIGTRSPG